MLRYKCNNKKRPTQTNAIAVLLQKLIVSQLVNKLYPPLPFPEIKGWEDFTLLGCYAGKLIVPKRRDANINTRSVTPENS